MGNFALQTGPCNFLKLHISPWESSSVLLLSSSLSCRLLPFFLSPTGSGSIQMHFLFLPFPALLLDRRLNGALLPRRQQVRSSRQRAAGAGRGCGRRWWQARAARRTGTGRCGPGACGSAAARERRGLERAQTERQAARGWHWSARQRAARAARALRADTESAERGVPQAEAGTSGRHRSGARLGRSRLGRSRAPAAGWRRRAREERHQPRRGAHGSWNAGVVQTATSSWWSVQEYVWTTPSGRREQVRRWSFGRGVAACE
jgi:hypothetical protein